MQNALLCIILLILTSASTALKAQTIGTETVSSTGGNSSGNSGSIEWTAGEPVSETYTGSSGILTTGVHQPVLDVFTAIEIPHKDEVFVAYPNPVKDELLVDFAGMTTGTYQLSLMDMKGNAIFTISATITLDQKMVAISLKGKSPGAYLLNISNQKDLSKSVKIVKSE